MSSAVGVDQSASDDGSHTSGEIGTSAIRAMIDSFRQEVAAALEMVKEVREAAGGRMVAPLPPGRAEGESGGAEWPAAGRGEAGVQSERGTVTSAQRGLGGRRLEIPSGRSAADGRRHFGQHMEETVHIYKSAPSTPKFDGNPESFIMWARIFAGFARQNCFFEAFESAIEVPIETTKNDPSVAMRFTPREIETADRAWTALTSAITDVKLNHRVWLSGSPSAAWKMLHERFAPVSSVHLELCQNEFNSARMIPGTDPLLFLDELMLLVDRLDVLGDKKNEHTVCLRFLGGLPCDFDDVRTLLMTSYDTLDEQRVRLAVSRKYQMILQKDSSNGRALVAIRNNNGNKGRRSRKGKDGRKQGRGGKRERRCFRCGERTYLMADCKAQVKSAASSGTATQGW